MPVWKFGDRIQIKLACSKHVDLDWFFRPQCQFIGTLGAVSTFWFSEAHDETPIPCHYFYFRAVSYASRCATDSPESIIYDHSGNEVGVIQRQAAGGGYIVLPTQGTLGLGYYDIVIPADLMRRRPSGGWETALTHEQLASFRPTDDRFWQSSGF